MVFVFSLFERGGDLSPTLDLILESKTREDRTIDLSFFHTPIDSEMGQSFQIFQIFQIELLLRFLRPGSQIPFSFVPLGHSSHSLFLLPSFSPPPSCIGECHLFRLYFFSPFSNTKMKPFSNKLMGVLLFINVPPVSWRFLHLYNTWSENLRLLFQVETFDIVINLSH